MGEAESKLVAKLEKYLTENPFNYSGAYIDLGLSEEEGEILRLRYAKLFMQIEKRHLDRMESEYFRFAMGTLPEASKFQPAHAKAILSQKRWNLKTTTKVPTKDPKQLATKMAQEHDRATATPAGPNPTFCRPNKDRGVQ